MYRINILGGNNVTLGYRYAFLKKDIKEMMNLFKKSECKFTVEKFIHIHGSVFCWSKDELPKDIQDIFFC